MDTVFPASRTLPAEPAGGGSLPGFETSKKRPFPLSRVIAVVIGTVVGIPLMLVGFIRFQSVYLTRASDAQPRDVVIAEVTQTTATVHWYTDQETQGAILYGTEPGNLRFVVPETAPTRDHTLVIPLLAPATPYYFTIRIGDEVFTNGGAPWSFTTKSTTPQVSPSVPKGRQCPVTTDCKKIQSLLGNGCTVTDYVQCIQRNE